MVPMRQVVRQLLRLAWPVALARLGIMGMGVVDVMVVGQFAPEQLAHQALGLAPTGVLLVTGIGLLTGVQVLAARAIGAGNRDQAGGAWRRGLVVSLVAGTCAVAVIWLLGARTFTAFGIAPELAGPAAGVARILVLSVPLHFLYVTTAFFLESIQRPLASMIAMWSANAVNLALNLALVPTLGAVGSAWCTVGARCCLALSVVAWVWRMPDAADWGIRKPASGPSFSALLGVGAAAALSQVAEAGAFSGMTLIAGRLGAEAVAAYQILLNVLLAVFMISLGVSSATAVLTSAAIGAGLPREASRASFAGVGTIGAIMLPVGLLVYGCSGAVARAYTANLQLAAFVAGAMWLAATIMLPDGGQVVAAAALRARGDNWFPTASHSFSYALVMPVLAYWLAEAQGHGVPGLMLAILMASVLSCTVLCARLWWLKRAQP